MTGKRKREKKKTLKHFKQDKTCDNLKILRSQDSIFLKITKYTCWSLPHVCICGLDTQHIFPLSDAAVLLQLKPMCRHGIVPYISGAVTTWAAVTPPQSRLTAKWLYPPWSASARVPVESDYTKRQRLHEQLQLDASRSVSVTMLFQKHPEKNFSKLTSSNFKTPKY